jgi:pyruvate-ferredoxin/flavodoxin oxidoreductase
MQLVVLLFTADLLLQLLTQQMQRVEGPAWANSLFEDNAEYGFGMATAVSKLRERIALRMGEILKGDYNADLKSACEEWIAGKDNAAQSREASAKVLPLLEKETSAVAKETGFT